MEKIGIIGLGNMGEAILRVLLRTGIKKQALTFSEAKDERAADMERTYGVKRLGSTVQLAKEARYVLLAVKPQDARDAIRTIAPHLDDKRILISIMAGVTTSNILSITNRPVKIVRMMPNICVKVGEGITGMASNAAVSKEEQEAVRKIFAGMGHFAEVSEELMDAITALGGSGPAFFLLFLEAMIDAGVKIGLPREKAKTISFQVAKGTLKMLEEEKIHPTVMRDMITSPGGTTIAGISVLEERAFKGSVIEAVERAWRRAKELSS